MDLDLKKFLPHGDEIEQNLLSEVIALNQKIKNEFSHDDQVLFAKLRMASSETNKAEPWLLAMNFVQDHIEQSLLNTDTLLKLNSLFTGKSELRSLRVVAGTSEFPAVDQLPVLLDEMCSYASEIPHAISRAAFIYQALCSIHPFSDGNGRTARLVADHTLIQEGFAPLIFPTMALAFVVPDVEDERPHLLALKRVKESTAWAAKLFSI